MKDVCVVVRKVKWWIRFELHEPVGNLAGGIDFVDPIHPKDLVFFSSVTAIHTQNDFKCTYKWEVLLYPVIIPYLIIPS